MNSTDTPMTMEQELREINEALLISSVHQHELTEQAQMFASELFETKERYRILFECGHIS